MFSKKLTKRVAAWVCMMAMVLGMMVTNAGAVYAAEGDAKPTLWLVGDSTVCEFSDPYYYPRYGYGTQIGNYLDGTYTIQNLAASGRSSLNYPTDEESGPKYDTLMSGMRAGDVLVIGFGHNDEKLEQVRYTNPNGDYTTVGSFEYVLYENYVKPAMDKGVEVILCTPIVRYDPKNAYTGSVVHVTSTDTSGGVTYEGGDYAQAIRDLGAAFNLTVVDLTELTKAEWKAAGAEEALYFHAWTNTKSASVDKTHINIYGAKKVAYMFAQAVAATNSSVAAHVVLGAAPTKEADLVSNPNYVEKPYTSDLPQSTLWSDYGIFKGTAFGDLGGTPSTKYYTMEADANGNMHIVAGKDNKGKVTSGADGIVMYYYKVPVGSTFSLKATATLNAFDNNKQVGFGLMARDDMYIDVKDSSILSDYVAAATSPDGEGGGFNCYYRKNKTLSRSVPLTVETLAAGKSYDLSIVSNPDGYACTFGKEPTQSGGYDFQLTSVDSDYVYIGMFVARNCDVTYSDIELIVDGKQIDVMTGEVIGGDEPGENPGGDTPVEPPVEPTPGDDTVDAFVARMYTIALEREVDPTGHADWVAGLANGTYDGASVGRGVFLSPEFVNKNLSNEEFLNRLYATFFNREADEAGYANWMNHLNANYSREFVLSNFVNSQEFMNLCDEFDIERGTLLESGNAVNVGMSQFVTRLYDVVLLRTPDKDGYNDWTKKLGTGEMDAAKVAASFFGSQEYLQKNKSDEDFLKDVYKAFFDRAADEAGMNNWLANLAAGTVTRDNIFGLFTVEQEWLNLLDKYGL